MVTNCINCGAVIEKGKDKCPYCGTPYNTSGFYSEIDDFKGTITIQGKTYNVYLSECEIDNQLDLCCLNIDGKYSRAFPITKRKFTLIEI